MLWLQVPQTAYIPLFLSTCYIAQQNKYAILYDVILNRQ